MKRTIGLMLSIFLIASVAFVSCKKSDDTTGDDNTTKGSTSAISGKFTVALADDAFCSLDFDGNGKVIITVDAVGGKGQEATGFNTDSETSEGSYEVTDGICTVHYQDVDMGDWDIDLTFADDTLTIEDGGTVLAKE